MTGHLEEVPAPGKPSWHGAEQLSQPAHRFKAGGPRLPRCTHARTCLHREAHTHGTHSRAHMQPAHTCVHARTQEHSQCTPAHTCIHTCTHITHMHAPPSRASRALGCNLGSRSPHAAPDLHAPDPVCLVRSHGAAAVPKAPRPQTHQAQALLTALHAPLSSPARPAIPCQALCRPYKRQVSLRSGPAAQGLCSCQDAPPRLGHSPAPGSPSVLCSWRPSAAAGPESSLGPTSRGLCTREAPSAQPLSCRFPSWR